MHPSEAVRAFTTLPLPSSLPLSFFIPHSPLLLGVDGDHFLLERVGLRVVATQRDNETGISVDICHADGAGDATMSLSLRQQ